MLFPPEPATPTSTYTYDWIENLLGLNMHSVERVLPEFQHPQVGETIELGDAPESRSLFVPPRERTAAAPRRSPVE